MSENSKLKVAVLWHMHQPFYLDPASNRFMMPWVRFHGLKDYLDMPLTAAEHAGVKVTFNLVPSLVDQIALYGEGYTDRHLDLSRISARDLSSEEKKEVLSSFFSAHLANMIDPYSRYRQLHRKRDNCGSDLGLAAETFSTSEWRDLQVWSNLVWIDPKFRKDTPIKELFEKGRDFTEDEKKALLDYELNLLKKILPTYQRLFREGKIDISFTPYYHPILPLLVDTDSAREALPQISLPSSRFSFPEDAVWQIRGSIEKYQTLFECRPHGMWPSEGSISEEVLRLMEKEGLEWAATDEDVLRHSLLKSGLEPTRFSPHTAYCFSGAPGVRLFFRDRGLSDKIGFVYSGWDTERAVDDFILNLKRIRDFLKGDLEQRVVPIILDGENAWEYYPDDGAEFLNLLYSRLGTDDQIEMISMSEAARTIEPTGLRAILAGSWINHNFRIWIGHSEDNAAWDLLSAARKTLIEFQANNPQADPGTLAAAWKQIYIAEGSDWCWWYGDDHIGADNDKFDRLFRMHLEAIYRLLQLSPPPNLSQPLHRERGEARVTMPESLVTPILDGVLTHYYEWSGSGFFDCQEIGGAMHRVDHLIEGIHFAFDAENFYIRLDFARQSKPASFKDGRIVVDFINNGHKEIILKKDFLVDKGDYRYIFCQLLEAQFNRKALLGNGSGRLEFSILLYSGDELMEKWPIDEPIGVDIPERDREIFWQV